MKKLTTAVSVATLMAFSAMPAFAQNIAVQKPPELQITDAGRFIQALIGLIFIVAALLVFVFLVWGGIQWMTSGGDKGATEAARNRITAALIGLGIVAVSWALVAIVGRFFGFDLTTLSVPTPY
jgi:hypothetical protein